MKIGLIGAGAIAEFLLKELNENDFANLKITSVFVRNYEKYAALEETYGIKLYTDIDEFTSSGVEFIVEAATVETVKATLPEVIKKLDMMVISIGALADEAFLHKVTDLASTYKRVIHLPSGAVGGLDLIQNAQALDGVSEVSLTTRKPAHTLIDESITEEKIIFEGSAVEAIKSFPKNINVSIVLSLAGLGIDETKVTIVADPTIDQNIHQVNLSGAFGEASVTIKNNPLPENPKTSYLAAMSILGTLKRMTQVVQIG